MRDWTRAGLLLLAVLVAGALRDAPVAAVRSRQAIGTLFSPATPSAAAFRQADARVIRSRIATIDFDALRGATTTEPNPVVRPALLLNLFDDVAYYAEFDHLDTGGGGGTTWVGRIPGHDLSTVTLASVDGVVAGSIVMPEAVYSIRSIGTGLHEIAQVDQSQYPPEGQPRPVQAGSQGFAPALAADQPVAAADDGSTIDVLVLYTAAAVADAGGASAMAARINLGISEANTSYANSGINPRLHLVASQQVSYTEHNDLSVDLDNITNYNTSTALGDTAASVRNTYGADLTMLITAAPSPNYCGISWLMTSVSNSFAPWAFSVITQSCISPRYSFAHELGHNMGSRHEWYRDNGTTPSTYAHGYVDTANHFVTMMAYPETCATTGGCTRLLYWSNPGVQSPSLNGSAPMGIPGGTKSDCPTLTLTNMACDADDHRTLNETAYTVANFRSAFAPIVTVNPTNLTITAGSTATFTAAAIGSPPPSVQWQVNPGSGGTWTNISGATSATYAFTAALSDSGKQYRAVFTNSQGTATTNSATINVQTLPAVTAFPKDVITSPGLSVSFTSTASGVPAPTVQWQTSADGGATWVNILGATSTTYSLTAVAGDHNRRFRAVFTNVAGVTTSLPAVLTVIGQMTIDPSPLRFGATKAGAGVAIESVTPSQTVFVTGVTSAWTATTSATWLQITGGAGTGAGQFSVAIVNPGDIIGSQTLMSATVTVTSTASSAALPVTLTIIRPVASTPPYGFFDLPYDGSTGLEGSFPVTGWALDDVGIAKVVLYRDPVSGEPNGAIESDPTKPGYGKIYIADALFVNGTRPDIESYYGSAPMGYRAGWGYLLLSWGLPNQGNGTYALYAYAIDVEGHSTFLGSKTIAVDNSHATRPFGAIDTPTYGGTASGIITNHGWALTPNHVPTCTITNGNVGVSIDSGPPLPVSYGDARADVSGVFPGFSNASAPGGHLDIDTALMVNGLHTISWVATDNCLRTDGMGSRYFWVLNGVADAIPATGSTSTSTTSLSSNSGGQWTYDASPNGVASAQAQVQSPPPIDVSREPVAVRQLGGGWTQVWPDRSGSRVIEVALDGRIEVQLPPAAGAEYIGVQDIAGSQRKLPVGSSLDAKSGVFYWQPAPGFLGVFDLSFTPGPSTNPSVRVRVVVGPPMRTAIDTPAPDAISSGPFTIAGWALDLAAADRSGVDTVHVWAYPLDGGAPIWIGVALYGDERPDVARAYGPSFINSAYNLTVAGLQPGSYDLVVYPHCIRTNSFEGAQVVRVTIK